jgi:hypothetical protein
MRAAQLFALSIGLIVAIGIAVSRMRSDPQKPSIVRVRTPDGSIVEMPIVRSNSGVIDPRIGGYLRAAVVYEESFRSEQGQYTKDLAPLERDRPANTRLYILRAGSEGIRMTAINSKTEIQCDVFMGDSATWAFGYAYDRGAPRCGKIR